MPGYVIAHEVGHHVQKLLGIEPKVRQQQQHATQAEANRLSVKMELQADCFAGVWGHNMQQQDILETGDLQEALNAAEAIGDDRLQQQSGRVVPDSFTHGTSKQRYTGSNAVSIAAIRRSAIPSAARCNRPHDGRAA